MKRHIIIGLILGGVIMLTVGLFDPVGGSLPYPRCPVKWLTGWDCPGCGSTRALHALLHGRVAEAWGLNPWLPVVLVVAGMAAVGEARGGRLGQVVHSPLFLSLFIALSIGWMIFRNLCHE